MPRKVAEVTYTVKIEPEELDFRGNCACSGDDAEDRKAEEWIAGELASGNVAAWCWVQVTAECEGYTGEDSLGGCCYTSTEELERDLLPEMKENALANLRERLTALRDNAVSDARKQARKAAAILARLP